MTSTVRRASAVAGLCTCSLAVALVDPVTVAPVAAAALLVAVAVTDGPLFDLLASPADRERERLWELGTFVLAASVLGAVAAVTTMPTGVLVASAFLVGYGQFADVAAGRVTENAVVRASAYCLAGTVAATVGFVATSALQGQSTETALATIVVLALSASLLAALVRTVVGRHGDAVAVLAAGGLSWLVLALEPAVDPVGVATAVGVTAVIGYVAVALGVGSTAGTLTGALLSFLTLVLGGYGWFTVLTAFFAVGSLSTKFRYEEKLERGVAEANDGARGSSNVLANAAVALVALLGYAAGDATLLPLAADPFLFAFAGSLATALADTLSSEVGGVYDGPRLITTLRPVEPGTDGAVTWQGELAGFGGSLLVACIAVAAFPSVALLGGATVLAAGVAGMTADSVLGATLEGRHLGNQGVNFLATLTGAVVAATLALSLGVVG